MKAGDKMINGITPDINAVLAGTRSEVPKSGRLSEPLSLLIAAAMYKGDTKNNYEMLCEILPYVSKNDQKIIEELLEAKRLYEFSFSKPTAKAYPKAKKCLSPTSNLSELICILKKYSSCEGMRFFTKMERAIDNARMINALQNCSDPKELLQFMGMGEAAKMIEMLPLNMQNFAGHET